MGHPRLYVGIGQGAHMVVEVVHGRLGQVARQAIGKGLYVDLLAKHDHVRGVSHLLGIVLRVFGQLIFEIGIAYENEFPRLTIDGRRRQTKHFFEGLYLFVGEFLCGVIHFGGVSALHEL